MKRSLVLIEVLCPESPPIVEAAGVYIVRVVAVVGGLLCMFRVADLVALAVKGAEMDVISNCGPRGFSVIYLYSQYCRFYFYEQNFSKNVKKK